MEITEKIRSFIMNNVLIGSDTVNLDNDDSFLEKGIIDSTGILELVAFIESEFDIDVKDEELIPDNFDSVSKMSTYISNKVGG